MVASTTNLNAETPPHGENVSPPVQGSPEGNLSHPTRDATHGPAAEDHAEGRPTPSSKTMRRVLITSIATLLGAGAGFGLFGVSPMILLGVLVGFLFGQTIHGVVCPEEEDRGAAPPPADSDGLGHPVANSIWGEPGMRPSASGTPRALLLTLSAWGLAVLFLVLLSGLGWFKGDGAGLALLFIGLPVLALLGLMGGPTAAAAARRTLKQIDKGQCPESERDAAQLALILSRLTTAALLALLVWLLVGVST